MLLHHNYIYISFSRSTEAHLTAHCFEPRCSVQHLNLIMYNICYVAKSTFLHPLKGYLVPHGVKAPPVGKPAIKDIEDNSTIFKRIVTLLIITPTLN